MYFDLANAQKAPASHPDTGEESVDVDDPNVDLTEDVTPRMQAGPMKLLLTPAQKFHKATLVTQKLNTLVCEVGTKLCHQRLQVLADVVAAWQQGKEVIVVPVQRHLPQGKDISVDRYVRNSNTFVFFKELNF